MKERFEMNKKVTMKMCGGEQDRQQMPAGTFRGGEQYRSKMPAGTFR